MSTITEELTKILVAIDGSEQSFHAASYAVAIAQRYDAELYALYVTSSPTCLI